MPLEIVNNASLAGHNGLRLPSVAQYFARIRNEDELQEAITHAREKDLVVNLMGAGSNVLLAPTLPGMTLKIDIGGVRLDADTVVAGGGENWHQLVMMSLANGLSGLENLSLIPGTVGAAPVQNIGAYGVELSEFVEAVRAIDTRSGEEVSFSSAECRFGYRDSLFRLNSQFAIVAVKLRLETEFVPRLAYRGLGDELVGQEPSAMDVSTAVCRIRRSKLPDPATHPNVGSFFKNPSVSGDHYKALLARYPGLTAAEMDDGMVKLSAAQLIDQLGFKGAATGDAAISRQHALVLVNLGRASLADVFGLVTRVRDAVLSAFQVDLEIEPVFLPFETQAENTVRA